MICSLTVSGACVRARVSVCVCVGRHALMPSEVASEQVLVDDGEKVSIWDWLCRCVRGVCTWFCACVHVMVGEIGLNSLPCWVSSTNYCGPHICCHPTGHRVCSGIPPPPPPPHTHPCTSIFVRTQPNFPSSLPKPCNFTTKCPTLTQTLTQVLYSCEKQPK